MVFAQDSWLQLWYEVIVSLMTISYRASPEAAESFDMVGRFGSCFLENMNVMPNVLLHDKELKLCFRQRQLAAYVIREYCLVKD